MTQVETSPDLSPAARGPVFVLRCIAGGALLVGTLVVAAVTAPKDFVFGIIYAALRMVGAPVGARLRARREARLMAAREVAERIAAERRTRLARRRQDQALRRAEIARRMRYKLRQTMLWIFAAIGVMATLIGIGAVLLR